ncbi:MAG: hypothetical protein HS100_00775 [Anaerolineales bacterium]|nr:hypothetical protein [Anaerolineales bacterium]
MINLDSSKWSELSHAYGNASDIPNLLRQLEEMPSSAGNDEPWFSIWSSLAHQGDVYSASFAAVPHVIRILSQDPLKADFSFFQFPAWVEICRQKKAVEIPMELEEDYYLALRQLPLLVASASEKEWDENFLACALSAIAAAKGFGAIADTVLELNNETASEFIKWLDSR